MRSPVGGDGVVVVVLTVRWWGEREKGGERPVCVAELLRLSVEPQAAAACPTSRT